MLNIRDISIRNKLVLMQVVTSVLVLGIFFAAFIITDIRDYKQRKADSMIGLAQIIATNNVSTLEFHDDDEAKKILTELSNVVPEIIHAGITDSKGKLFALYNKTGADSVLTNLPPGLEDKKYFFAGKKLFVSNDISSSNKIIGKVFLEIELSELEEIKKAKYEIAGILLLVALGVSILIALVVQNYISKRLLYLVDKIKEVSNTGNYNQTILDNGKDEISTLTKVYNNLMEQVKQSQQRKDEFIGIASHELKTPLTSIKGYLQLLEVVDDKATIAQCVTKATENVNKLERLIKDLLDVSKIQSGQLVLNIKAFNIDELIDETIAAFQMISVTHKITRENNFNNKIISADRQRIEQVLINILSNAIKYSPGEKSVLVYSILTEADIIIKVRDFGIGVPQEEQLNIFERFYRTKNMSVHISGFGLGLYICSDIIKRHNGKLWVESQGNGSTFFISLPLII